MPSDRRCRLIEAATLLMAVLACANQGTPAPASVDPPLPALSPELEPVALSEPEREARAPAVRLLEEVRFTLNIHDADLRSVLLGLGKESPLNVVVEPGVGGTVTADLEDVSLLEILDQIVLPRGYYYEVRGNLLSILASDRQTRTYRVDYPNYVRQGNSDLTFSGAISSRPTIGESQGSGGEQDLSSAGLQTTQTLDFWTELEEALRAIVFGPSEEEGDAEAEDELAAGPGPSVIVSRQSALVTITAEAGVFPDVERYLEEVARSTGRQVLIDARILEVTLRDEFEFGVDIEYAPDLGGGTAGTIARMITPGLREATVVQRLADTITDGGLQFGIAREDLGAALTAIARQTDVRVVSTPRITTLNNHKALIKVVRNEVFFIADVESDVVEGVGVRQTTDFVPQIIPIGVTLDVTPYVSKQGEITMHIHPSVSEVVEIVEQPTSDPELPDQGSLPVINLRETDTVLRVADGGTIVIGGLVQSREFKIEKKIPLLAEIPWLGQAFQKTESEERRSELLILLTPTVIDAPRVARVSEEAMDSIEALDSLRRERQTESPWWRRPFGRAYGVKF
jgi:MSHA biogenesis protein MshL